MRTYRCPTCGKLLTKSQYEKALRVDKAREEHYAHKDAEYARKEREQKAKQISWEREQRIAKRRNEQEARAKAQLETKRIREKERANAARQQAGLREKLRIAQERLRQRERGTNPQSEGLEFEERLAARLRKEFPEDEVVEKGKGGDILHTINFNRKSAGVIIYECKRTPSIQGSHVVQTHRAKQIREADFAVLVTTGKKKGFNGFAQMGGVSVVSPLAVVPLVALLRNHLIEMARLKISKEKRGVLAQQLMHYIGSPQFKNPIEEVVQRSSKLKDMIQKEAKDHLHTWRERWAHYETINWNASQIQNNLRLVMHGAQPKPIGQRKPPPLRLPAPS